MASRKMMKLGFMLEGHGRSFADWRHPDAAHNAGSNYAFHVQQTLIAERGKFDFVFLADTLWCDERSAPHRLNRFESAVILGGLAPVTSHIGLVGTVSSTFTEPFNLARQMASLDHISNGRIGWNLVTSDPAGTGDNFSRREQTGHGDRYRMAHEYLDLVQGLWDSWEDDALIQDKEAGIFFDPEKLHTLNHKGEFYQVKGPLNIIRSPQGHPVIFTATFSEEGRRFAGQRCEAVFFSPDSKGEAQKFFADVKGAAVKAGRDPDKISLMPSTKPVVGSTMAEAQKKYDQRAGTISLENSLSLLGKYFLNHDFTQYDPDGPFPMDVIEIGVNGFEGAVKRIAHAASVEKQTLRQIALRYATPRGTFVGTPEYLADKMIEWVEDKAVDGFILGETLPGEIELFVEEVVPILRKRGVFRREYEGTTLRDNLGLDRPENRHAAGRRASRAVA